MERSPGTLCTTATSGIGEARLAAVLARAGPGGARPGCLREARGHDESAGKFVWHWRRSLTIRPQWHSFVAYACEWEPIPEDGLERYAEGKPR